MKCSIILISSFCFITCLSGQTVIDTTVDYKSELLKQLRQVVINWPNHIDNYRINSIRISGAQKLKNDDEKQMQSEKLFSLEGYGSFYRQSTKELQFHKLKETFVQNDTLNNALYDQYKHFAGSYISQADSSACIEFNLINVASSEQIKLSEIIFYNYDGIKFDNILFFINAFKLVPRMAK